MDATKSAGIRPFSCARDAYEQGMPLRVIRRRFKMNDEELRDMCPEEFEEGLEAENVVGGY